MDDWMDGWMDGVAYPLWNGRWHGMVWRDMG